MNTYPHSTPSAPRTKLARLGSPVCRRCGRPLTDGQSRTNGIGPECAAIEAREAELAAPWPLGCAVAIVAGWNEGSQGVVTGHRFRDDALSAVQVETMGRTKPLQEWYRPGELERLAVAA